MIELGRGSATSEATPQDFFTRWVHHDTWSAWSPDTDWVRVEGPVAVGTRGTLKPAGGPKVAFTVTECAADDAGAVYTDTTKLLGARLVFRHDATRDPASGRTSLGALVTVAGPLARLWALILGGGFRESAQADLDRLVALVEGPGAA